jgi:DNA-binding beta-propeller fold protein YncE
MTKVDLHGAETAALKAQALIEEARRLHRRRQRKVVIGIAVVALLIGVAVSAIVVISHGRSPSSTTVLPRLGVPSGPEDRTAYVTTSSGIVVVDLATDKVVRLIEPHGSLFALDPIAIAPGGHTAYVVSDNVLTPIDLSSGSVKSSITLGPPTAQLADGSGYPSSIAIAPDGRTAYVAIPALGTIVPVHLDSLTVGTPIAVGGNPVEIAIDPNGKNAYVTDSSSSRIDVVNLVTDSVEAPITGIADPHEIAIAPNGQRAYVSTGGINLSPSVVPIDLSTGRVLAPISLDSHGFGDVPGFIAASPDGRTVYVTFAPTVSGAQIFLLSTTRNKVIDRLGYFSGAGGIALASNGDTLYVLNTAPSEIFGKSRGVEGNALVPIDLDRGRIEKPISIPATPRSVAIALF